MLFEEHARQNSLVPDRPHRVNCNNNHRLPPPLDTLTVNCDGSFQDIDRSSGIGPIIRKYAGAQQAARCIHLRNIGSTEKADCMGLWESVN